MPDEEKKVVSRSPAQAPRDRRTAVRHEFRAMAEMTDPASAASVEMRVADLAVGGCRVETARTFPLGSTSKLRITKDNETFEATVRVVSIQGGKGMGLLFAEVVPAQRAILDAWLAQVVGSREAAWRDSNRRKSQRIMLRVPVTISGYDANGIQFKEKTFTEVISAYGAMLLIEAPITKGRRLVLAKGPGDESLECIAVHIGRQMGEKVEVGVKFAQPNPAFWKISFPPSDWSPRHPDAKDR
jgi:PilZ domain-containing protein